MNGEVVVITGASAGIGAALARAVAAKGGKPVLCARRRPQLEALARELKALAFQGDLTKRAEVQALLDTAVREHGHVDVWVNNVGRGITRPVTQLTDDDLDEMMRVNVKSALYGMQAAVTHFKARGKGHVINVSSMLGRVPFVPVRSAYSGAKHFLNALTANLRMELHGTGIHVTLVSPGLVATEFGVNALHGGADSRALPAAQPAEEVADVILRVIEAPAADVYTRPESFAQVAAYYSATDLGSFEQKVLERS